MVCRFALSFLLLGVFSSRAWAYAFIGPKWTSTPVTVHLQLGPSSAPLLDGSASWGASAEAALNAWNLNMRDVRFAAVPDSTAAKGGANSINNLFFAADIYGSPFGTGVLAVTLMYSSGPRFTETDVIYNNRLAWNAYRGAQRTTSMGAPMYDFYRVTLHELGHVLGLDHPDTAGQSVLAIMNSRVSSTDGLMADDIDGARALYGAPAGAPSAPVITAQPASRSVTTGQAVTFSVTASSTTAMTYQWTKSGGAISGATAASYTITAAALSDTGHYAVIITNASGSATSSAAMLTVTSPAPPPPPPPPPPPAVAPTILAHPAPTQSVSRGGSVTFTATVAGTPPLRHQWLHYSTSIPGATSSSFTLVDVQPADAGIYYLRVANDVGTVASNVCRLEVRVPPTITVEPANRTATRGTSASFTVTASGTPEPSYQWRKDGVPLGGMTSATLVFNAVQPADAGSYSVIITNSEGAVTSRAATLAVEESPTITAQPVAQTVVAGARAGFTIAATGTPAPTYQWRKDSAIIAGATGPTFTIDAARVADAGAYRVVVTNSAGSITSASAPLVVHTLPAITTQPVAQTVSAGTDITFGLAASGIPVPTYQWRKDGVDIAGATGPTLSLSAVQPAHAGAYSVVVSNAVGSTTSVPAALRVNFSRLLNLSTRGYVASGGALTPGFVVRGAGPKPLVIRAIGPTLNVFGVNDALLTPKLAVLAAGAEAPSVANERWNGAAELREAFASVGAFPLRPESLDSAARASLPPSAYTVRITAAEPDGSGVALAELYDAGEPSTATRLVNASTLGFAGAGERALTPGFVISGNVAKRLLIRVVGPSLQQFGVPDVLVDPQFQVLPQGLTNPVAFNDDWAGTAELKSAFAQAGAFGLADTSKDSAVAITLPPGAYSVVIVGANAATGYALVEIYDLDP